MCLLDFYISIDTNEPTGVHIQNIHIWTFLNSFWFNCCNSYLIKICFSNGTMYIVHVHISSVVSLHAWVDRFWCVCVYCVKIWIYLTLLYNNTLLYVTKNGYSWQTWTVNTEHDGHWYTINLHVWLIIIIMNKL